MPRPDSLFSSLPETVELTASPRREGIGLLRAALDAGAGSLTGLAPATVHRWLAFGMVDPFWIAPAFGTDLSDVPPQTQMLLWDAGDGRFGLVIPLIDGDLRMSLAGGDGLEVRWDGGQDEIPSPARLAVVAAGNDPFAMIADAMATAAEELGTFRVRTDKRPGSYNDLLGWCTWDAFYHEVDQQKVLDGLASFAQAGCPVGFCIVDDGWMDVRGDYLRDVGVNAEKFPQGLSELARKAKDECGLEVFGVWHNFTGYWAGVDPQGPLADRYRLFHNRACIRPWEGDKQVDLHMIAPEDIGRFYEEWYEFLRSSGVEMVKVDGQGTLALATAGKLGRGHAMRAYQIAQQSQAVGSFAGNCIQCMSNSNDVAMNLFASTGWRNSNDYMPARPLKAQQHHVAKNVMHNFWTSTFAVPDWDMFQTHGPCAEFHAAARAISGGPVYVCDKPGRQQHEILRRLVLSGSRVLRCDRPALPAADRLLVDAISQPVLLKATNRAGKCGMVGLFHCSDTDEPITDTCKAGDVHDLPGSRFAAWSYRLGQMWTLQQDQPIELTLDPARFDVITFAPLTDQPAACLGLADKYAGAAAVMDQGPVGPGAFFALLAGASGSVIFWSDEKPAGVWAGRSPAAFDYDPLCKALRVEVNSDAPVRIWLEY